MSHEGYYSTRHTVLWSCTHITNIIDLSRKIKMLWPGQDSKNNYLTFSRWKITKGQWAVLNYVSPSNEGRHIVVVWFFLPLPLLLSEACPDHNVFVFQDRSMIFGISNSFGVCHLRFTMHTKTRKNCFRYLKLVSP
jgi:hypothetical protein